ncbi:MAG: sulfotransferase [Actinomycetota bacterium]|nr:sulfotransferase [Actinomycetota bacterium]
MSELEPNFFVIGAARSGTTSLAAALREHQDVFVTTPKEPHFLAFAGRSVHFSGPGDDLMLNQRAVTNYAAYLNLYSAAGDAKARGDASVSTLYYAERSITSINTYFPHAKMIVILRDPVHRAFSSYQYLRSRGFESCGTFEEALDLEDERIDRGWHHQWHYTRASMYAQQLVPFIDAFGAQRVLVLFFDDLKSSGRTVLESILQFLEVGPLPATGAVGRWNSSGDPRSDLITRMRRLAATTPAINRTARALVPQPIRQRLRSWSLKPVSIPQDAEERLRRQFQPSTGSLRDVLRSNYPSMTQNWPPWLQGVSSRPLQPPQRSR